MPGFTTVVNSPSNVIASATVEGNQPRPSRDGFQPWIDAFGPRLCVQVFDDGARKRPRLARTRHGLLDDLWLWMVAENDRGCGIFASVNRVLPELPRIANNVDQVRAFVADNDNPERREAVEAEIARRGPPPDLVIEASPGKRHYYWLTTDCLLEDFKPMQQAIAAALGTDPSICDLPRVMRLPGFLHRKAVPFLVRVVYP